MLTRIKAAKCIGIDAVEVVVEVDIGPGIGIHLVGLADVAVKESLLRIITSLMSMDFKVPGKKIVINLAPADLRKSGSGYDLPIAVGMLVASGQLEPCALEDFLIMGELALDGSVRGVNGALPYASMARDLGLKAVILPLDSALEAIELSGIEVYGVKDLKEVLSILSCPSCRREYLAARRSSEVAQTEAQTISQIPDFKDIIGQQAAKRGLEIAAAGGHNVMMIGAPGSGKSSLAKALAGILPPMSEQEALLTSKVYSVYGAGGSRQRGLIRVRPFRAPHHTASLTSMIGGGSADNIVPGEVSLSCNGVLVLDEFAELPRNVTEALRGPMEDRKVVISRLKNSVEFPSSFMLVAASNPCPCGYWGEGDRCRCAPSRRESYLMRLSGPILDRIDVQLWLHPVSVSELSVFRRAESSAEVSRRVAAARRIQQLRFLSEDISTNAQMSNTLIEKYCPLSPECRSALNSLVEKASLSMRSYFRIIKLARTIADLQQAAQGGDAPQSKPIEKGHILEAAGLRMLDKIV